MKIKLPTRLYFTLCEYRALCFKEPRGCKSEGKTRCLQTLLSSSIFFLNPPAHVFFLDAQSGKFYKVSVSIAFTRLISILVGKLVCLLPDPSLQGALGAPERQLPCGPAPHICDRSHPWHHQDGLVVLHVVLALALWFHSEKAPKLPLLPFCQCADPHPEPTTTTLHRK